jgi:hypothetical protein
VRWLCQQTVLSLRDLPVFCVTVGHSGVSSGSASSSWTKRLSTYKILVAAASSHCAVTLQTSYFVSVWLARVLCDHESHWGVSRQCPFVLDEEIEQLQDPSNSTQFTLCSDYTDIGVLSLCDLPVFCVTVCHSGVSAGSASLSWTKRLSSYKRPVAAASSHSAVTMQASCFVFAWFASVLWDCGSLRCVNRQCFFVLDEEIEQLQEPSNSSQFTLCGDCTYIGFCLCMICQSSVWLWVTLMRQHAVPIHSGRRDWAATKGQ